VLTRACVRCDFRLCKIHILDNYITKMIHLARSSCVYQVLLLLLFLLFIGPCPVFYPTCLSSCDVDVKLLHQRFGGRPGDVWRCLIFHFLRFLQASSSILFVWFLHARLLILVISWHLGFRGCCEIYLAECCELCTSRSSFPLYISLVYIKLLHYYAIHNLITWKIVTSHLYFFVQTRIHPFTV